MPASTTPDSHGTSLRRTLGVIEVVFLNVCAILGVRWLSTAAQMGPSSDESQVQRDGELQLAVSRESGKTDPSCADAAHERGANPCNPIGRLGTIVGPHSPLPRRLCPEDENSNASRGRDAGGEADLWGKV